MGFDGKALTETEGILRLAVVICTVMSWRLCVHSQEGNFLCFFAICDIVFLVLGCFGLGDNEIVKLVDKIVHLVAAILVTVYAIMWAYDWCFFSKMFGLPQWTLKCELGWLLVLAVGIMDAAITSMIWK